MPKLREVIKQSIRRRIKQLKGSPSNAEEIDRLRQRLVMMRFQAMSKKEREAMWDRHIDKHLKEGTKCEHDHEVPDTAQAG